MPRSPDFFRSLNEQLLEQLEEFARQPGQTGDKVLDWLSGEGIKASRSAVYRWLQDFRLEDRTRRASETARAYLDAARASDPQAVTEASLRKFEELVFDHLVGTDATDAKDLMMIASAMKQGLGSRKDLIELRKQQAEAVKTAEAAAKSGASAADVVGVIKTALGIAA